MGIINFTLTLLLILLLTKAPSLSSLINQKFFNSASVYRAKYEEEKGRRMAMEKKVEELEKKLSDRVVTGTALYRPVPSFNYTGDEVFRLINEVRRAALIGELSLDPNLCYLASYRLSQLLELGKLDAHEGFINFDPTNKFKYERVGENLAYGYTSTSAVVNAWEKSPGHNLTLKDPVNTLGCVASNRGFAVFIAGREH